VIKRLFTSAREPVEYPGYLRLRGDPVQFILEIGMSSGNALFGN